MLVGARPCIMLVGARPCITGGGHAQAAAVCTELTELAEFGRLDHCTCPLLRGALLVLVHAATQQGGGPGVRDPEAARRAAELKRQVLEAALKLGMWSDAAVLRTALAECEGAPTQATSGVGSTAPLHEYRDGRLVDTLASVRAAGIDGGSRVVKKGGTPESGL